MSKLPDKCFWCHKESQLYAYDLCQTCYRWFYRNKEKQQLSCSLCDKPINKRNYGMCSPCRKSIHKVASSLKRINTLQDKLSILSPVLSNKTKTDAYSKFEHIFKPTQKSFLKILLDRYYDNTTLAEIGKEYNVSREYVRQCQDKAVQILFEHPV
jgi:hypothetical protein